MLCTPERRPFGRVEAVAWCPWRWGALPGALHPGEEALWAGRGGGVVPLEVWRCGEVREGPSLVLCTPERRPCGRGEAVA